MEALGKLHMTVTRAYKVQSFSVCDILFACFLFVCLFVFVFKEKQGTGHLCSQSLPF